MININSPFTPSNTLSATIYNNTGMNNAHFEIQHSKSTHIRLSTTALTKGAQYLYIVNEGILYKEIFLVE